MNQPRDQEDRKRGAQTDTVFSILTHPYRRAILQWLLESERWKKEEVVSTLATEIDHDRTEISTALRHTHLPKLTEAGYVDVDRDVGTIERGPQYHVVEPLVEHMNESVGDLAFDWP